jgi:hypothetical protein
LKWIDDFGAIVICKCIKTSIPFVKTKIQFEDETVGSQKLKTNSFSIFGFEAYSNGNGIRK